MKTPVKIAIVAALAAAVVAAVVLKNGKAPATTAVAKPVAAASDITASPQPAVTPAAATNAKLPKLLDLGSTTCVPCKAMAPILEELKKEYAGRMNVEFIDVWQDEAVGKQYNVDTIPTQIFFDAEGKELFRHTGFFGKEDILAKWRELGADVGAGKP